jgi:hypothetical protein
MIFLRKKFNQNQTAVLIQRLGWGEFGKDCVVCTFQAAYFRQAAKPAGLACVRNPKSAGNAVISTH